MDITLIRTFLDVAATGSFVAASERLFVTQSAVGLRIARLEDGLGQTLFTRSKAGAVLTPAGLEFEHYALSMLKLWEEARAQVAVPEGYDRRLTLGAQYSLWPRVGFRMIDRLAETAPSLSVRAELGMPDRLTRFLSEGIVQGILTYSPQLRPGFEARQIMQEELVMVAAWEHPRLEDVPGRYVLVDWGPEFVRAHALSLPQLKNAGLTLSLGALAAQFIENRGRAAYLPARYVRDRIAAGVLSLVAGAPRFSYPVWSVWRDDCEPVIRAAAEAALAHVADALDDQQDKVLESLADLTEGHVIAVLGDTVAPVDTS